MAPSPGTPLGGERPLQAGTGVAGAAGVDVPMPALDEDADMGEAGPGRHHCPIPSCSAHNSTGHAGWELWAALRVYMDAHQLGTLPGALRAEWLRNKDLVACPECSRLVSRRCNGGVHRTCMAVWLSRRPARPLVADGDPGSLGPVLASLPSLDEIFAAPVATRDFVSAGLLPPG